MRQLRLRVWWLMVAVAVAGSAFGIAHRRARFQALSAYHASKLGGLGHMSEDGVFLWYDKQGRRISERTYFWRVAMWRKYEDAARHPWLPVAPDPPPPE